MIGPRPPTFVTFVTRLIGSLIGGLVGAVSIFAIYILGLSLGTVSGENPHQFVVTMGIVFAGTLLPNLISLFSISYVDREMYPRRVTILTQAFIVQIVLFLFSLPIYLLILNMQGGEAFMNYIIALHLLLSVQISAILLEILSLSAYKIVGLYGIALGSFISIGTVVLVYLMGKELFLLFIIPPLLWVSIEFFRGIAEFLYFAFYRFYGIDVLNEETKLEE